MSEYVETIMLSSNYTEFNTKEDQCQAYFFYFLNKLFPINPGNHREDFPPLWNKA